MAAIRNQTYSFSNDRFGFNGGKPDKAIVVGVKQQAQGLVSSRGMTKINYSSDWRSELFCVILQDNCRGSITAAAVSLPG